MRQQPSRNYTRILQDIDSKLNTIRTNLGTLQNIDSELVAIQTELGTLRNVDSKLVAIQTELGTLRNVDSKLVAIQTELGTLRNVDSKLDAIQTKLGTIETWVNGQSNKPKYKLHDVIFLIISWLIFQITLSVIANAVPPISLPIQYVSIAVLFIGSFSILAGYGKSFLKEFYN
jgi:hypothetical protein